VTYWAAEIVFLFLTPRSAENGRTHPLRKREDHAMEWKNLLQELNNPLP
jgi:hypothetical protein